MPVPTQDMYQSISIYVGTPRTHRLCSLRMSNTSFPPKHLSTCPQPAVPQDKREFRFSRWVQKEQPPPAQGAVSPQGVARGSQHHWEPQQELQLLLQLQCCQILSEQSLVIHMSLTQACNSSQFKRRMNDFMSRSSKPQGKFNQFISADSPVAQHKWPEQWDAEQAPGLLCSTLLLTAEIPWQ